MNEASKLKEHNILAAPLPTITFLEEQKIDSHVQTALATTPIDITFVFMKLAMDYFATKAPQYLYCKKLFYQVVFELCQVLSFMSLSWHGILMPQERLSP